MIRSSSGLLLVLVACSAEVDTPDTTPPSVVSITPAAGDTAVWLHDPIRIVFSEPLGADSLSGVHLTDASGEPIFATYISDSETTLSATIADDVTLVGELRLELGAPITDLAGNELAPTTASWIVPPWARTEAAGTTPSLAVDHGTIVMARSVDTSAGRRVAVSEWDGAAWSDLAGELGAQDAALPSITFDASGAPFVVWSEFPQMGTQASSIQAARWNGESWQSVASPGEGSFVVAARPPAGEPVIAYTAPATSGTVVRVRVLAGDQWQPLVGTNVDIPVHGAVAGLPQVVATAAAAPIVTFVDASSGAIGTQLRILEWKDAWSEVAPIALGPVPAQQFNRVSIAARNGEVVVAYDTFSGSFGVHVVRVVGLATEPLGGELDIDPSGDAQAPSVALDIDGAPVVAWRELIDGNWRGLLARWSGSAWVELGGQVWSDDPARAIVRPALALVREHLPIVAWSEVLPGANNAASVRLARLNAPNTPPPVARVSIAGCTFDDTKTTLSSTGCFTIANGRATPHAGLIPFDVTSELWSDGALKRRWIALPDGQALTTPSTGAWSAPPGSLLVKEFAFETTPGDARTRRVMETRFLAVGGAAIPLEGFSFRWRADGSDADLLPDAPSTFAWPLDNGTIHTHSYPSRAQCRRCHNPSNGPLLGVRTGQLARKLDYGGVIADQLATLEQMGVIAPQVSRVAPFTSPHDTSLPLETRVRGYLAANCSHCHNPTGERPTRDFRWETPLAQTLMCGPDSEVVAGAPASSVIVQRISTRIGGMPPLATLETDPLAIDLVTRWIAGETNCQ